jgi:hypothetical protein
MESYRSKFVALVARENDRLQVRANTLLLYQVSSRVLGSLLPSLEEGSQDGRGEPRTSLHDSKTLMY